LARGRVVEHLDDHAGAFPPAKAPPGQIVGQEPSQGPRAAERDRDRFDLADHVRLETHDPAEMFAVHPESSGPMKSSARESGMSPFCYHVESAGRFRGTDHDSSSPGA